MRGDHVPSRANLEIEIGVIPFRETMTDAAKLPYLLKLLDDDSEEVRKAISREFAAFGASLKEELTRLPQSPDLGQRKALQTLLEEQNQNWFRKVWSSWFGLQGEYEKLEAAHALLCEFQTGFIYPVALKTLLDGLAEEYTSLYPIPDLATLSEFLFQKEGIRGISEPDYYNPHNSNLVYVIREKKGIPISLVSLFMLVGYRVGLAIEGCNFPGHFLARTFHKERLIFIDCFNGGKFLEESELAPWSSQFPGDLQGIVREKTDAETIMVRVLRNLVHAYERAKHPGNSELMMELSDLLKEHLAVQPGKDDFRLN